MKRFFIAAAVFAALSLFSPARAEMCSVPCRLVEQNGVICVFEESGETYSTGIPVKFLPANDRERLREGITVSSEIELLKILEDFGS